MVGMSVVRRVEGDGRRRVSFLDNPHISLDCRQLRLEQFEKRNAFP